MTERPRIFLLGDAILDNYHTLGDSRRDLKFELTQLGYQVDNYAADDVKVKNLLVGIKPRNLYRQTRSYPYPLNSEGKLLPLELLQSSLQQNTNFQGIYDSVTSKQNLVVLSMGGNDIQAHFMSIIRGADALMKSILTKSFILNFTRVLESTRPQKNKVILLTLYLPYLGPNSSYSKYSNLARPVMDKWNKFVCQMAQNHDIAVLDLYRTLDFKNREHYGTDITRLSNLATTCLANCISQIEDNYQGYKVYYAPNCDSKSLSCD